MKDAFFSFVSNALVPILVYSYRQFNPSPAERICPAFANSVDPDQLASEEAN